LAAMPITGARAEPLDSLSRLKLGAPGSPQSGNLRHRLSELGLV